MADFPSHCRELAGAAADMTWQARRNAANRHGLANLRVADLRRQNKIWFAGFGDLLMLRFTALTRSLLPALAVLAVLSGAATNARAEALLVVEADSGKVLHAENATYPWYPASVTKLMTTYVTLQAVKNRRITLDSLFKVSQNAAAQQPAKMGFPAGTEVTVDNALKMLMVKSANDIAVVLAEGVSGSIENFAAEMNLTAQRLGMTQTTYVNPNGLPAEGQVTSARDLAMLARALLRDMPEFEYYLHVPGIKYGRRTMRNYNALLGRYPGADGMKTGFICASGFNLVASATRNGKRVIAVVLGSPSSSVRTLKAAQLLERGLSSGGLSWLTPSLGTVENLVPIKAQAPGCGKRRCQRGHHRRQRRRRRVALYQPARPRNPLERSDRPRACARRCRRRLYRPEAHRSGARRGDDRRARKAEA
jgi:D-alanyl-D-alanine carboxypeptidase